MPPEESTGQHPSEFHPRSIREFNQRVTRAMDFIHGYVEPLFDHFHSIFDTLNNPFHGLIEMCYQEYSNHLEQGAEFSREDAKLGLPPIYERDGYSHKLYKESDRVMTIREALQRWSEAHLRAKNGTDNQASYPEHEIEDMEGQIRQREAEIKALRRKISEKRATIDTAKQNGQYCITRDDAKAQTWLAEQGVTGVRQLLDQIQAKSTPNSEG